MKNGYLLQNLEWQGNSKAMYEAILKAVPSLFRGSVKKSIERWVAANNIHVVTEDIIFKAVNEIAPVDLAQSKILPGLEQLRTK